MSNSPLFTQVQTTHLDRNNFDLSFKNLITADFGKLIPIMCKPVIPGDTWNISQEIFARMSPMDAPILDKINATVHTFFVPYRLIWNDFEKFITGGKNGTDVVNMPKFNFDSQTINSSGTYANKFTPNGYEGGAVLSQFCIGSLLDYLGAPVIKKRFGTQSSGQPPRYGSASHFVYSQLPIRAYNKIFNDYYVDENVGQLAPEIKDSNDITGMTSEIYNFITAKYRAYKKDYFTSALPWTQRGPAVTIPISSTGTVTIPGAEVDKIISDGPMSRGDSLSVGRLESDTNAPIVAKNGQSLSEVFVRLTDSRGDQTYQVDMSNAQSTINDLRTAYALQRWYERNARGGSRYIEQLLSHFGVVSDDARLQRSEYLGGQVVPVVVDQVTQTSQSTETSVQGTQTGQGYLYGNGDSSSHYFTEHGIVMSILSIMPDVSYVDQVPREWLKESRFDWYFPEFEHLGEQAILNKEIYDGYGRLTELEKNSTFGYTPRYAEYKFSPNEVHGDFKQSLDYWHLGRSFNSLPILNDDFLRAGGKDNYKIFPVTDLSDSANDRFYLQIENKLYVKRPMAFYADPV